MTGKTRYAVGGLTMALALAVWVGAKSAHGTRAPEAAPPAASPKVEAAAPAQAAPVVPQEKPSLADSRSLGLVRDVVARSSDTRAKELLRDLEKARDSYDEVAREYDELNRQYQDDFVHHASADVLRSDAAQLDSLMKQLWDESAEVYRASTPLSDIIVAHALAENSAPLHRKGR